MQDKPAAKIQRVFRERPCIDCGEPFTPRSGRAIRCDDCRDGAPRALCGMDGCDTELRRDNRIGFCEPHKFPTARVPVRYCEHDGCERTLRIDNTGGYCPLHYSENEERQREYRDRQNARARAITAARPDERPFCSVEDCQNRLRSDNTTGRCREHHYAPLHLPECSVEGCVSLLTTANTIGRCQEHRGLYWGSDARKCGEAGCGKTLHADNATGYCHEHRTEWRNAYNRAYYQAHQAELVEYATLYREVYAEEHRINALLWALANPERKKANDGAYRERNREGIRARWNAAGYERNTETQHAANARRRQRVQTDMDALDRALSAAYRMAIHEDPCFYCGVSETHHVDHFFPLAKGGTDIWTNLVRSCRKCNLTKSVTCGTAFLLRAA